MSILTLIFLLILILTFRFIIKEDKSISDLSLIKSTGLFAAVMGILGQLLGLFSAFQMIENIGSMSPAMLAGGLKVSSITSIYGLFIYLVALALAILLKLKLASKE